MSNNKKIKNSPEKIDKDNSKFIIKTEQDLKDYKKYFIENYKCLRSNDNPSSFRTKLFEVPIFEHKNIKVVYTFGMNFADHIGFTTGDQKKDETEHFYVDTFFIADDSVPLNTSPSKKYDCIQIITVLNGKVISVKENSSEGGVNLYSVTPDCIGNKEFVFGRYLYPKNCNSYYFVWDSINSDKFKKNKMFRYDNLIAEKLDKTQSLVEKINQHMFNIKNKILENSEYNQR